MPLVLSGTNGISTNGTNWALQPDSSGRTLSPNQTAFMVVRSSSVAASTSTTAAGGTVHVNNGNAYNNSTGTFTAPVTGTYFFEARLRTNGYYSHHWDANFGFTTSSGPGAYVNVGQNTGDGETEYYTHRSVTIIKPMVAGDTIYGYYNNAYTNAGTVSYDLWFGGFLIG